MDAEVDPQIWDRGLDGRTVGFVMRGGADSSNYDRASRGAAHGMQFTDSQGIGKVITPGISL
jgi:hypothetical protein